ncbi:hypothetical protein O181_083596 [Austropuccinia psidii MF-1]|uniref:Uncharacterized protein n=1 Tax=Austropuccinia psidii MF-1 TaxID=1389203 RepID=A0A9Q3II05_9BASI|nr:hypothetical protein [Austropuccinia psidii MF-1]
MCPGPSNSSGNHPSSALSEHNESYQLCISRIERMLVKKNQLLEQIAAFQAQDHAQDHVIYLLTEQLCIQDIQISQLQARALHELTALEARLCALLH